MQAVNIVGFKNSGKTTLSLALARELKRRNISVGMVKSSHHSGFGTQGTDSAAMLEVTDKVVVVGPDEAAAFWKGKKYIPDMLPLLEADMVVMEGGKSLGWLPRIVLARTPEEVETLDKGLALATFVAKDETTPPSALAMDDIGALADMVMERGFVLPGLDCGTCGFDQCEGLAQKIVLGKSRARDCRALDESASVKVNGVNLAMNPFVMNVFKGSVLGMLREFKGFAPGTISIEFKV